MLKCAFWGGIVAVVIFAGWCEFRRSWREAGRTALRTAMRTVPAQAPSPSNEDCEDALMTGVIDGTGGDLDHQAAHAAWMFRDDAQLSLTWGPVDWSAYIDEYLDDWMRLWAEQQEGR